MTCRWRFSSLMAVAHAGLSLVPTDVLVWDRLRLRRRPRPLHVFFCTAASSVTCTSVCCGSTVLTSGSPADACSCSSTLTCTVSAASIDGSTSSVDASAAASTATSKCVGLVPAYSSIHGRRHRGAGWASAHPGKNQGGQCPLWKYQPQVAGNRPLTQRNQHCHNSQAHHPKLYTKSA